MASVHDLAFDLAGNLYIVGGFQGTSATVGAHAVDGGWQEDGFNTYVAKIAPDGTVLWASGTTDAQSDEAYAVAIDSTGAPCIGGYERVSSSSVETGRRDAYLACWTTDGFERWRITFGDATGSTVDMPTEHVADVAVIDDTLYAVGSFEGTMSVDGHSVSSRGGLDVFVLAATLDGSVRYVYTLGSDRYDYGENVIGGPDGDLLVALSAGGVLTAGSDSITGSDEVRVSGLLRLGADGLPLWLRAVEGGPASNPGGIGLGAAGAVVFGGTSFSRYSTSTGTYPNGSVLRRFSQAGDPLPHPAPLRGDELRIRDLAMLPDGGFVLVGSFWDRLMTPYGTRRVPGGTVRAEAGYMFVYGPDGTQSWANVVGSARGAQQALSVAVSPDGRIAVGGSFAIELLLGDTTVYPPSASTAGFVLMFTPRD